MRESVSKPLHQAWEANNAIYREPKRTIESAIAKLGTAILNYEIKCEEDAAAERKKAEAEAETERKRLADSAAKLEDKAAEAAIAGDTETAETLFDAAGATSMASEMTTARHVEAEPTRVAGSSRSWRWSATVPETNEDKIKAMQYIIANPQFLSLVTFDQPASNKLAMALGENFAIPGFTAKKNPVLAQRGVTAISPI